MDPDLSVTLLFSPSSSSSSSSRSEVLRKSKLPRAVSTARLWTLDEQLHVWPFRTHTYTCYRETDRHAHTVTKAYIFQQSISLPEVLIVRIHPVFGKGSSEESIWEQNSVF
jgi:hypothetical protein